MIYLWAIITVACGILATINFAGLWGIWFLACVLSSVMEYVSLMKGY